MLWLANRNGKDFVKEAMDVDLRQLICEWILTSTYWDRQKTRKRCDQMKWIFSNMDRYAARWFYFDMFHKIHLHVNGEERKIKKVKA
jgi:hypothetical protein